MQLQEQFLKHVMSTLLSLILLLHIILFHFSSFDNVPISLCFKLYTCFWGVQQEFMFSFVDVLQS